MENGTHRSPTPSYSVSATANSILTSSTSGRTGRVAFNATITRTVSSCGMLPASGAGKPVNISTGTPIAPKGYEPLLRVPQSTGIKKLGHHAETAYRTILRQLQCIFHGMALLAKNERIPLSSERAVSYSDNSLQGCCSTKRNHW